MIVFQELLKDSCLEGIIGADDETSQDYEKFTIWILRIMDVEHTQEME